MLPMTIYKHLPLAPMLKRTPNEEQHIFAHRRKWQYLGLCKNKLAILQSGARSESIMQNADLMQQIDL